MNAIDGLPLTSRQSALHMNNQIFTFGGYVDHKNTIDSNNINIINPISKKLMKSVGPKNSSISPNARASSCFLPYSADDKEFSEESFSSTSPEKTPPIIMLFGESSKDGIITRHNDVWLAKILVNEVEWVRIYPKPDKLTGLSPNPTTLNSCVRHAFMGTNTVFFFGGITTINDNETRLTNSIWSLSQNRDSLEWRWQLITTHDANLSNSNDLVPTSRATSIFNIENMQLLIYGGFTDLNNIPKLYIFDLCAMKWVERVNRNYDRMDCPEKISVFLVVTTALILIFAVLVILFISKKFRKSQFLEKFIMDINSGNPENKNNWKYYILKNRYFKKLATVFKISSISTSKKLVSDRIHKGHIPQHDDQIIVNVGDIFEIREIYLDDWVFGFNVNTSKEGIIPLNCLENLNPLDYPEILNNKRYKPLVHGLDQLGNNHNEDFNSYEAQLRQRQSQRISFPPNYAEIQNDNIATD
ncbi:hypothetical protein HK099_004789 [Clydaea vesicula]|uniref:SH3 domain-containing protein n=1 Tax=Clydaea vesicula TaxID=447962 RepID=A0AAD5Y182_9FUNG|nr:hypothetical protein HK099_004789 [Clydaea vesicula]